MFLENYWYCAALSGEVHRSPIDRIICNESIVFYRRRDGSPVALQNRCPHRHAPLSMGQVIGDEIQCGYHGLVFDQKGICTHIPHQDKIPKPFCITSYPAEERWGFVWIWYGDPDRADPAQIPEMPWMEDPSRSSLTFRFPVRASDDLMADNLLDTSHADYLHSNTIGSRAGTREQDQDVNLKLDLQVEGDIVHYKRVLSNVDLAPIARLWGDFEGKVTRIHIQRWAPPNSVHTKLEIQDESKKISVYHDDIMTPETESCCHYFHTWSRDFHVNGGPFSDADVRRNRDAVVVNEDLPMVEAQQRMIDFYGGNVKDMPVKSDKLLSQVYHIRRRLRDGAGTPWAGTTTSTVPNPAGAGATAFARTD